MLMPGFFHQFSSHHKTCCLTEVRMNPVKQVEIQGCSYLNAIKSVTTFYVRHCKLILTRTRTFIFGSYNLQGFGICFLVWLGFFWEESGGVNLFHFYPFSSLGHAFSLHFLLLIQIFFYNAFDPCLMHREGFGELTDRGKVRTNKYQF